MERNSSSSTKTNRAESRHAAGGLHFNAFVGFPKYASISSWKGSRQVLKERWCISFCDAVIAIAILASSTNSRCFVSAPAVYTSTSELEKHSCFFIYLFIILSIGEPYYTLCLVKNTSNRKRDLFVFFRTWNTSVFLAAGLVTCITWLVRMWSGLCIVLPSYYSNRAPPTKFLYYWKQMM